MLTKQAKKGLVEGLRRALYGPAPKDYRLADTARGVFLGDIIGKAGAHELARRGVRVPSQAYKDNMLVARISGGAAGYGVGKQKTDLARKLYRRRVAARTSAGLLGAGAVGGGAYLATRKKK